MEFGGKGSFQVIKLQRLALTSVCRYPEKGMAPDFMKSNAMMTIFRMNVCAVVNI